MKLLSLIFLFACVCIELSTADVRTASLVNGGVYKIQSDNDQSVLSAEDNGVVNKVLGKVNAELWRNADEQKLTIRNYVTSTETKIMRTMNPRRNANNNISLQFATQGAMATLRYWEIKSVGNSKWQIKNSDGLCLQNMGRGKSVAEKTCVSTNRNQKWEFLICNSLRCSDSSRRR
jgi:Tfp pilus assembly protein PilE